MSTLTGISGLFSLSGFTQLSVWRSRIERRGKKRKEAERNVLIDTEVLSLPALHQTVLVESILARNVISHLQDVLVQLWQGH